MKPKNLVKLTLTATQFVELMRLFDWRFQFINVDHDNTKKLWAVIVRQTGGIPTPAYDLGEKDPPKMPENRVMKEGREGDTKQKGWWQWR